MRTFRARKAMTNSSTHTLHLKYQLKAADLHHMCSLQVCICNWTEIRTFSLKPLMQMTEIPYVKYMSGSNIDNCRNGTDLLSILFCFITELRPRLKAGNPRQIGFNVHLSLKQL